MMKKGSKKAATLTAAQKLEQLILAAQNRAPRGEKVFLGSVTEKNVSPGLVTAKDEREAASKLSSGRGVTRIPGHVYCPLVVKVKRTRTSEAE